MQHEDQEAIADRGINHAVAERHANVRARVDAAARRSGRATEDITLLGASKVQTPEVICAALRAGVSCLGENYVQEASQKQPAISALLAEAEPNVTAPSWHMIGALQSNKAKLAVSLFDVIETIDRPSLAVAVDKRARAIEKPIRGFVQVNLSGETQKAGTEESSLAQLLEACDALEYLTITGLMTIPAPVSDPGQNRPVFAQLRDLRDELRTAPGGAALRDLSMGMSKDFEIAIEEGATVVRVGSDLFGPRPPKPQT